MLARLLVWDAGTHYFPESVTIYGPHLTLILVLFDYIADQFGGLGSLLDVRTVGYCSVVEAGLGVLLV